MVNISKLARKVASEGVVLLKNSNSVLPLKTNEKIAIFGRCQIDYYKSGTGSGGAVHVPYQVNLIEGLKNNGKVMINETLLGVYQQWIKENPFDDGGGGWAAEPWFQKEMALSDELVSSVRDASDKAVVVIGRTAGEDQDNEDVEGSYRLTNSELDMLKSVTNFFDDVIVILNVSNIIDMTWMDTHFKHPIKGLLYGWHGGMEGGNAIADILTGEENPSGRLTDTIAKSISDYPSNRQFGNSKENIYEEDIYVGYRYFQTFKNQAVIYPFGYGLSYTSFAFEIKEFRVNKSDIELIVSVKNTGSLPGKAVIQVYCSPPQGKLGKAKYILNDFIKTRQLNPESSEEYRLSFSKSRYASYDDSGVTGYKSAYVLEAGTYTFYLGKNIRDLQYIGKINQEFEVLEQLNEALAPLKSFNRFKAVQSNENIKLGFESVAERTVSIEKRIYDSLPEEMPITKGPYTLKDVERGTISLETFVAQLTRVDLATLVKGEGMCSPKVTTGTASAFGGLTHCLKKYGIPVLSCADGPSGIRLDSGKNASQVPIGTSIACTWNPEIVERLYECIGRELVANNIDTLLGPGMNIHRHPLNGRNFEYFSEDPIVTGKFAVAVTKGLRHGGSSATLKHFLVNNQEVARSVADSVVSERALREIYLKGFEMAIKEGGASSVMTSYNLVNGHYTASNYDLNTTILRGEWGFKGIVMTDWWAKMNHPIEGGLGDTYHKSYMVRAQNDLYMVVDHDKAHCFDDDDLVSAVEEGHLTLGELQRSAINILGFILESHTYQSKYVHSNIKCYASSKIPSYVIGKLDALLSQNRFSVKILEKGTYQIIASARFLASHLSQSTYNLCINEEVATVVQMHGSDEDYSDNVIAQIDLEEGYYDIEVEFIRKGIEVQHICIKMQV